MKALVAKMNGGKLSPKSVNTYFRVAASVVASAEDADSNPLYPRKWNPEKLDLPVVDAKQQHRPTIDEKTMTFLASCRNPNERMLFILCGATGMRIGEVFGLEIDKHFADDFTTIRVRQQARGSTVTTEVKTKNAIRDIDVHPGVARLLRQFIGGRKKDCFLVQGMANRSTEAIFGTESCTRYSKLWASKRAAPMSSGVFGLPGCASRKHPRI